MKNKIYSIVKITVVAVIVCCAVMYTAIITGCLPANLFSGRTSLVPSESMPRSAVSEAAQMTERDIRAYEEATEPSCVPVPETSVDCVNAGAD